MAKYISNMMYGFIENYPDLIEKKDISTLPGEEVLMFTFWVDEKSG